MGLNIPPDLNKPDVSHLPGSVPKEHEFDISENETISGLSGWMGFVGIVLIVLGILQCIGGLLSLPYGILTLGQGVCLLMIGIWTWRASRSFRMIVTTDGSDITLLMDALRKLRSVYTLQGILLIILLALVAFGIILAVMAVTAAKSQNAF